jgi:hypothetical protein
MTRQNALDYTMGKSWQQMLSFLEEKHEDACEKLQKVQDNMLEEKEKNPNEKCTEYNEICGDEFEHVVCDALSLIVCIF